MSRYPIEVFWSDEDQIGIADVPDLAFGTAHGPTPHEAVAEVELAAEAWLEGAKETGRPIPNRHTVPYEGNFGRGKPIGGPPTTKRAARSSKSPTADTAGYETTAEPIHACSGTMQRSRHPTDAGSPEIGPSGQPKEFQSRASTLFAAKRDMKRAGTRADQRSDRHDSWTRAAESAGCESLISPHRRSSPTSTR